MPLNRFNKKKEIGRILLGHVALLVSVMCLASQFVAAGPFYSTQTSAQKKTPPQKPAAVAEKPVKCEKGQILLGGKCVTPQPEKPKPHGVLLKWPAAHPKATGYQVLRCQIYGTLSHRSCIEEAQGVNKNWKIISGKKAITRHEFLDEQIPIYGDVKAARQYMYAVEGLDKDGKRNSWTVLGSAREGGGYSTSPYISFQ